MMNVRSARTFCVIVAIVMIKNEFLTEKVGGRFIGLYREIFVQLKNYVFFCI